MFRDRGDNQARAILDRPRGSPTAKNKVLPLIEVAKKFSIQSETEFVSNLLAIMLNEARRVPKNGLAPGQALTAADFEPDARAWDKDFLGKRP